MKRNQSFVICALVAVFFINAFQPTAQQSSAIKSFDVGLPISKVRAAHTSKGSCIVASSYEGTVFSVGYDGAII